MTPWLWVIALSLGVLGWTWVIYPVCICLVARVMPVRAVATPVTLPTVTAILATRDDVEAIVARVEDFFAADYPSAQLRVVVGLDSAGASRVGAICAACAARPVEVVVAETAGGKSAGLNAAVQRATGDILVFSDVQQRFAPDAIRVLVSHLASDSRVAAVGGALQLPGDRPDAPSRSPVEWYWYLERMLRAAEARLHSSVGVSGSIYAMWRREWVPMPDHLILDDVWLPMHLVLGGRRVGYALDAQAWDARSTSAAQERVRKVRTLTGNFQLMAWLPAILVPIRNPIWVQFVSHKVLRLLTPWLAMALVVGVVGAGWSLVTPTLLPMLLVVTLAAMTAVLLAPRTRGVAVRAAVWGWTLQVAVVQATVNGVRGRWDVWR